MLRSTRLALVAVAPLVALPAAALAQATQAPAAATPPATSTTPPAPSPSTPLGPSRAAPGSTAAQRVEEHIRNLRAQLRITRAEQPQWEKFADVMRENARAMDQIFTERMQQYSTMNALQNMQSYAQIAAAHADHVQKLVGAFADLYNAMPERQQKLTDQVFRANAETGAQKRLQTGRNE
jgi:periplasmic protein CpxP/Spy